MGRIGIMGGTFDPIHKGHLMLGEKAYSQYELDEVWYMPSGQPPHKKNRRITDAEQRYHMVQLALEKRPHFRISDLEVHRQGNTYTAQTLKLLKDTWPQHEFFFIIGADSLYELETWYHPEQVLALATILVAPRIYERNETSIDEQIRILEERYSARILKLHSPQMEVSSESIRTRVGKGEDIKKYVPDSVADYIASHHLYQEVSHHEC